jgi:hypothetical protein
MKSTVAYLSSISRMKYNIEKNSLINKLSGLENTVRKKFNIKVNTKLKDIYIKSKEDDKTEVTSKRSST